MAFPIIDLIIEGTITLQGSDITTLLNNLSSSINDYDAHIASTSNPHNVTKTQVGLGNVDNTSDVNKPISIATQTALNLKYDASNPNSYETPAQLSTRDTNNRSRTNHTGTQTASTISDFTTTVRSTVLTGLGAFTNVAILATDSILSAMSKLQGQINAKANISGQVFTGNISATNLSNTNTGDETTATIQTKRPLKTINSESLEGAGNIVITGGGPTVEFFTKRLASNQSTTANVPISLVGQSFEIPPGHCLTIWGTLIFTSAATNTGASYGLNVLQETGADANAVGSFLTYVNLASTPAATGLSDGDVINVAQNSNTNYMTIGTSSAAGNNSAFICTTIYNLSTNGTTFITMAFNSETNGTAVTAQANSSATAILGLIQ